ncbi:MAG: transglycosylase SLT domain-containing protein [Candidatus Margulisiibacteriota bacterium]|nr:transglycosylase SLT domain-containing protein [Candidatus Margulisiibacteriota bacterium]
MTDQIGPSMPPKAALGASPKKVKPIYKDIVELILNSNRTVAEKLRELGKCLVCSSSELPELKQYRDNVLEAIRAYYKGDYNRALRFAMGVVKILRAKYETSDIPKLILEIAYPRGYWDEITAASEKHGNKDPYLISAMIRQESRYKAKARSGKGATGLMQVRYDTARPICDRLKLSCKLYEPAQVIEVGTSYILEQIKKFGDEQKALAAYNGGPGNARKWQSHCRSGNFVQDCVKFPETQEYINEVLESRNMYRELYSDKD